MTAAKDSAEVGARGGRAALRERRERIVAEAVPAGEVKRAEPEVEAEFNGAAERVFERAERETRGAKPGAAQAQKAVPRAMLVRASEVTPRRVDWLWPGRIPFGMVTLLDGDPGLGKSTLTLDIVARVTRGDPMPDGGPWGTPRNAIVVMLEDAVDVTIRPRLDAANADTSRVFILTGVRADAEDPDSERPPVLPIDVGVLRDAVLEHGAKIVVIDPLMAYLGGDTDSHKDQDIRRALTPLARLAEDTGCAIVIVRHLRKSGGPALYRGGGSIGIMGSARVALFLARDPADADARILASSKCNIAKDTIPALRWRLVDTESGVARAQWEGAADGITADMLANPSVPSGGESPAEDAAPGQVDRAVDALREMLADGAVSAKVAEREVMAELECSQRTVRRATNKLRVHKAKVTDAHGRVTGWTWALPTWPGGHADTARPESDR